MASQVADEMKIIQLLFSLPSQNLTKNNPFKRVKGPVNLILTSNNVQHNVTRTVRRMTRIMRRRQ